MAAKGGQSGPALIDALFEAPHRFSFFQAVKILERAGQIEAESDRYEGRAAVGEDGDPRQEAVRFRAQQSMTFAPTEVARLVRPEAADQDDDQPPPSAAPELTVSMMGLTGPSGVLPQHYTEQMIQATRAKSIGLRDLFDLFNHRLISLFVRSWEKYRLTEAYARFGSGGKDPISQAIFALVGFGTGHLRNRLAVGPSGEPGIDDEALLHYSGHLSHWPRSAAGLEALLSDYFERPVRVDQFQGRWLDLGPEGASAMPTAAAPEGRFNQLGVNAVAGDRVWDVQSSFRIQIGPLAYDQFVRFMPDGDELRRLAHLTRLYVGPDMSFDVQLTLRRDEVPEPVLGRPDDGAGPRLGWNTWMASEPYQHDLNDAVYVLDNF